MNLINTKRAWDEYCQKELNDVKPILNKLGFTLDETQVHIGGERYLISGKKLVLAGQRVGDDKKVIIKVSSDVNSSAEIIREQKSRKILGNINFAYHIFLSPEEIMFKKQNGFTILITSFIEKKSTFLELPFTEQFFLALKSFEAQEGVHATTYAHAKVIENVFGIMNSDDYIKMFKKYRETIMEMFGENEKIKTILAKAEEFLAANKNIIEQYCGFLTHSDFVPHNIRVNGREIYLLDHSSLRLGNKYDGWARFINFMTLYNRPLEIALCDYVKKNRSEGETLSLHLMRIYRLTELMWYYTERLEKTSGDNYILSKKRIEFWTSVLEATLDNKLVSEKIIREYESERNGLRSEEESKRQVGLH